MTHANPTWLQIEQAGGIEKYVQMQLEEKGYLIQRRINPNKFDL